MTQGIKDILMNHEVIAIDQDKAGKQGHRLSQSGAQEIWVRDLAGNAKAVALFNRGGDSARMSVKWADLGVKGNAKARDLWSHSDVKVEGAEYTATVPSHGVAMLRVSE